MLNQGTSPVAVIVLQSPTSVPVISGASVPFLALVVAKQCYVANKYSRWVVHPRVMVALVHHHRGGVLLPVLVRRCCGASVVLNHPAQVLTVVDLSYVDTGL